MLTVLWYQGSTSVGPPYHQVKLIRCGTITHSAKETRQQKQQGGDVERGGNEAEKNWKKRGVSNTGGVFIKQGVRNPLPNI